MRKIIETEAARQQKLADAAAEMEVDDKVDAQHSWVLQSLMSTRTRVQRVELEEVEIKSDNLEEMPPLSQVQAPATSKLVCQVMSHVEILLNDPLVGQKAVMNPVACDRCREQALMYTVGKSGACGPCSTAKARCSLSSWSKTSSSKTLATSSLRAPVSSSSNISQMASLASRLVPRPTPCPIITSTLMGSKTGPLSIISSAPSGSVDASRTIHILLLRETAPSSSQVVSSWRVAMACPLQSSPLPMDSLHQWMVLSPTRKKQEMVAQAVENFATEVLDMQLMMERTADAVRENTLVTQELINAIWENISETKENISETKELRCEMVEEKRRRQQEAKPKYGGSLMGDRLEGGWGV